MVVLSTILLLLLSLPITGKLAQRVLNYGLSPLHAVSNGQFGAVVVPLGGLFQDSAGKWWPKERSVLRSVQGLKLAKKLSAPLILSGGRTAPNAPAEAEVTRDFLESFGAPLPIGIEIDRGALNSFGTANYIANRSVSWENKRVVLVTNESHLPRMTAVLRKNGVSVCVVPVSVSTEIKWSDLVPSTRGYLYAQRVARELAAIVWYHWNDLLHFEDLYKPLPGEEVCRVDN